MDVVAGLVDKEPEEPLLLRSGNVVGVVLRTVVLVAQLIDETFPQTRLFPGYLCGISPDVVSSGELGVDR